MERESIIAAEAPKLHVARALLFGVGAELLTILSIVLAITIYRLGGGHTPADVDRFGAQAGLLIGPAGGAIYTLLMGLGALRGVSGRFVTHGLIVGAAASAVHLLGVTHAPGGFQPVYFLADAAKLVAGVVAGWLASRSR